MVLNDVFIYVFAPLLESEDENISYYYDFTQSIAEYTKIFAELNVDTPIFENQKQKCHRRLPCPMAFSVATK
jgi:hypothetical protein